MSDQYILNSKTMVVHKKGCRYVKETYSKNIHYTDSLSAAMSVGYKCCQRCLSKGEIRRASTVSGKKQKSKNTAPNTSTDATSQNNPTAVSSLLLVLAVVAAFINPLVSMMLFIASIVFAVKGVKAKRKERNNTAATQENEPKQIPVAQEPAPIEEKPAAPDSAPTETPATDGDVPKLDTKTRTYQAAGVTHYVDNIMAMAIENSLYDQTKKEIIDSGMTDEKIWKYEFFPSKLELQPEPENPEDPNAIKILIDDSLVGYIKSGSCRHVLKLLERDAIGGITCTIGGGPYKIVEEDYDVDRDKAVYSLTRGESNFFVHLEITEKA